MAQVHREIMSHAKELVGQGALSPDKLTEFDGMLGHASFLQIAQDAKLMVT